MLSEDELSARLRPAAIDASATALRRIELDYTALHRELRRKGATLQLLWEEYAEANPGQRTCRYTQFCQKYKDWAKSIKRSMRQQHRAGEKLFADFAGPPWRSSRAMAASSSRDAAYILTGEGFLHAAMAMCPAAALSAGRCPITCTWN